MGYSTTSIKDIISKINVKYFLPAIQRKYVWSYERIINLFDSLLREYPIGTFLFWKLDNVEDINDYTFYKFIQEYNEYNQYNNEKAPSPLIKSGDDGFIGVLDGQQRLSSLYLALQGSYAYKIPKKFKSNIEAYPVRNLYLNLMKDVKNINKDDEEYDEKQPLHDLKFIPVKEFKEYDDISKKYWYNVREILTIKNEDELEDLKDKIVEKYNLDAYKKNIKTNLLHLYNAINNPNINYFPIDNVNSIDQILDIFVRINSGGVKLTKTDLLLSTIIAHWDSAREVFDDFQDKLNNNKKFDFDMDVIMKTCLCLLNKPVKLEVKNFNEKIVNEIYNNWNKISAAMLSMRNILVELGFTNDTIRAYNATIPISLYIYLGGDIKNKDSKEQIRKYITIALIKQIFGRASDSVIKSFNDKLRENNSFKFLMDKAINAESFKLSKENIDSILTEKKGGYTLMLLTMLYPHYKYNQISFHQDHMHPDSKFKENNLKQLNLSNEEIEQWISLKDTLPNLRILEGSENESKNNDYLLDWLIDENIDIPLFKQNNYIDQKISLEFKDFIQFYNNRKKKIKEKLIKTLCL
jgi:uncharacterized protein with ParB-like and HNH nuclease domain